MATKISEDTNVQLDLKTIGIIIAGTVSLASMWFTLQGDIDALNSKIDNFSGDEFVQKMEFKLKDELVRNTIMSNSKKLDAIEDKLNTIDDRIYNLNQ